MAKADSVLSTPPTTRLQIDQSMFPPKDPTRRHLLTIAAGGAVAALPIVAAGQAAAAQALDAELSSAPDLSAGRSILRRAKALVRFVGASPRRA